MAKSILEFKFNNPVTEEDSFIINSTIPDMYILVNWGVTLQPTGSISQDLIATRDFFENNYGSLYITEIDNVNNTLTVKDPYDATTFRFSQQMTDNRVELTLKQGAGNLPIKIEDVSVSGNSGNCDKFNISVTTNYTANKMYSPVVIDNNTDNPIIVNDLLRDDVNKIDVNIGYITTDYYTFDSVKLYVPNLRISNFNISVVQTPNNNTVNISPIFLDTPSFSIEYSLDDVNYYKSSSFSGLVKGTYNIYIRDSIGCKISSTFEVKEFNPNVYDRKEIFEFSQMSSLIHVFRDNKRKNYKNTLACEERNSFLYSNPQPFQKDDGILTNQFKSSYENFDFRLYDSQDNEISTLNIEKISNLINIQDERDAFLSSFDYKGSKYLGLQYKGGNIYNTDGTVKETYYNNGSVPNFMTKGDNVGVDNKWFKVLDVLVYNNQQTLILDLLSSNSPFVLDETYKVQAVYNYQDFDFYEYKVNVSSLDGIYYVKGVATDSLFSDINFVTERFEVKDYHYNTYYLEYYNTSSNLNTYYGANARFKLRIPYEKPLYHSPIEEIETFDTDKNSVSVESTTRSLWTLDTMNLFTNFARKLDAVTTNDRIFLEDISYIKSQDTEQNVLGQTNSYRMKIYLKEANYVYSNGKENLITGNEVAGTGVFGEVLGVKSNN